MEQSAPEGVFGFAVRPYRNKCKNSS